MNCPIFRYALLCCVGIALLASACAQGPSRIPAERSPAASELRESRSEESWPCIGTWVTLVAWDADPQDFARYAASAKLIFASLESSLSIFNPDSEISVLNRSAGGSPVHVSPRTREVLELSVRYSEVSDGYFDITVAPLVKAWGFAGGKLPAKPLDEVTIREALKSVGYRHIILSNNTARLDAAGVSMNLGGIAKGYAIDVCYAEFLKCGLAQIKNSAAEQNDGQRQYDHSSQ